MWLELIFIAMVVVGIVIVLSHRVRERYLQLDQIGEQEKKVYDLIGDSEEERRLHKPWLVEDDEYKNKYEDGDYSKFHQRRAKGQIRDDGLDH